MFSKSITNSSQFLMMPQSSQNLYFHLGMNADDDGFCEHFTIMRMTESKPDDLKVLQAKGFITIFDDRVLVITDWKENNYLRSDRYTPSKYLEIYKDELKALSTTGIPNGDQMATQDKIGKDRIGKVSNTQGENKPVKVDERNVDIQEIWDYGIELGFTATKQNLNRYAITRLLHEIPKEKLKKIIEYARKIQDQQYAPRIYNFLDLEEKLPKLKDFLERQKAKKPKTIDLTNL
jgi:hypothetical protein